MTYEYRCDKHGSFPSRKRAEAERCPVCKRLAARDYTSVAVAYHPTKGK